MTNKYKFSDQMNFQVIDYNKESLAKVRDDYPGAFKPEPTGVPHPSGLGTMGPGPQAQDINNVAGRGLVIKVAATHAGLVTRNNGFYLPDKMRNGTATWTEHYQKPIQVHHEDHQDPVGRVIAARYVETVGAVTDRFKNHVLRDSFGKQIGTANEKFWRDFCDDGSFFGKLQQIKVMDSILNDPHYSGVGYIELTADITDPATIQKVMDGRFLTGSVGAVSDKAVCSVCTTNWLEEEHCGHKPGGMYDGKKCFVVAGNLEYDEWSFVNTPADRHALVLEAGQTGITDSKVEDTASRVLYFVPTGLVNEEGSPMKDTKAEAKPNEATIQDATDVQESNKDSVQADASDVIENTGEGKPEEDVSADPALIEDSNNQETVVQDGVNPGNELSLLADKIFTEDGLFEAADEVALYDLMLSTLTADDGFKVEEVKLSDETRKTLPSSAFCGPKRSFPVIDEAHFVAATRLAAQFDALTEGDVESDLTVKIKRKGKALGFVLAQPKDSVIPEVETQELHIALKHKYEGELSDEAKTEVAKALLNQLAGELGKEALVKAAIAQELAVSKDMLDVQVEETLKQEDAVGELRDQLSALRRELSATYDDVAHLEDRLIDKASEAREAKVARLKDLHRLDGSLTGEVEASLATISDEALGTSLTSILAKVDTGVIADKLNNGLSRIPDETVANPAAVTEPSSASDIKDTDSNKTMEAKPNFATQRLVDQTYHYLFVKQQNPFKAKRYYTDQVNAGLAVADPEKMLVHDNKEE